MKPKKNVAKYGRLAVLGLGLCTLMGGSMAGCQSPSAGHSAVQGQLSSDTIGTDQGSVQGDTQGNAQGDVQGAVQGGIRNLSADVPEAVYCYAEAPDYEAAQFFSKELFVKSFDEANPVLSPVSAYMALALAGQGAKGDTAKEFDAVLGENRQAVADQWMTTLPSEKEGTQVLLANSAWIDEELDCEADWLSVAASSYKADVYKGMLASREAMDAVNSWIDRNTKGLIKDFLSEPMSEETRLALFNTLYFKGKWVNEFDPFRTVDRRFTLEGGKEISVPMMSKYDEDIAYVKSDSCDGIILPYRDSDLLFVALKPVKEGVSVRQMAEGLDMAQVGTMVNQAEVVSVDLWLPKFEVTFDRKLNDDMIEMGITKAFDPGLADFTGIGETESGNPLYISLVRQKAVFILDEEGTEAAAVTEVFMEENAVLMTEEPLEVHFDKPFLYMVLDPETDMPLFMGIMDDPSKV